MSMHGKGDGFVPLVLEDLTESLKEKARIELFETKEAVRDGIEELKKLIKEKQVPTCTDDDFLIMFLRSNEFNVTKGFEQLKSYSYQRHVLMNYCRFLFADKIMPAFHHNICGVFPKRDHEGRAIIYLLPSKYSPDICEPDDVLRAVQVLIHFVLKFPATQVSGIALISDAKVGSFQTLQCAFRHVKISIPNLLAYPGRFRSINIVNTNVFVRTCVDIIRTLIPTKLNCRVTLHDSSDEALLDDFDASILPTEFGGTMGPLNKVSEECINELEDFIPTLQASNRYFKRNDTVPFPDS